MQLTPDDVLAVLSRSPCSIGDLGLAIAGAQGHDVEAADGQPVGQWLGSAGLSLSALQKVVDQLVREGQVVEPGRVGGVRAYAGARERGVGTPRRGARVVRTLARRSGPPF